MALQPGARNDLSPTGYYRPSPVCRCESNNDTKYRSLNYETIKTTESNIMEGFSCKPRTNHHYQPDSVQAHVRAAVEPLLDAFGVSNDDYPKRKKERSCYGHKEKIFGIAMSHCGNFCATAGQDSIVIIWDLQQNNKLLYQLPHDKRYECLRVAWASPRWAAESLERKGDNNPANLAEKYYILATSAADGTVRLWGCKDPRSTANKWSCHVLLDHSVLLGRLPPELDEDGRMMEEDNKPQIYSLQFIDPSPPRHPELVMDEHYNNSLLLTSSDEYVHLWEVITETDEKINLSTNNSPESLANQWRLSEALSMHFSSTSYEGYGVTPCHITEPGWMPPPPPGSDVSGGKAAFGGERNPEGLIFVFDASHCPANGLLAAALSDGTIRITNRQGRCLSILNLPGGGPQSHVLSFCWDRTGTRLATCVGSGHLVTWHLDGYSVQYQGLAIATCISVLEGGTCFFCLQHPGESSLDFMSSPIVSTSDLVVVFLRFLCTLH